MQFTTPSTKEHTMKRFATIVVSVVLAALALSAVASAKPSPSLVHGGKASPAHHTVRAHANRAPAAKLLHLGHHHAMV
jgi:hypothetical protein